MAGSVDVLWQRAMRYLGANQPSPARAMFEAILAHDSTHVGAQLALARLEWASGSVRSAASIAFAAAKSVKDDPVAIIAAVAVLLQVGETALAHELLSRATGAQGRLDKTYLLQLAGEHQALEQHADALACLERARVTGTDSAVFRFMYAMELASNGRLEEVASELEACIASGTSFGRIFVEAARLRRATPADNHLATMDLRLAAAAAGSEDRAALEFARYKELEDLQRFEEAWTALATRAVQPLLGDQVDHAGHRIGPINGGRAVLDDLDAQQNDRRNHVGIKRAHLAAGARRAGALTVEQHERAIGA